MSFSSSQRQVVLLAIALVCIPATVHAQGLSFRLAPEAGTYRWASDLGFADDELFLGGSATLGFGEYVALRGVYRFGRDLPVSFAETDYMSPVGETSVDVDVAAADMIFRLGHGALVPMLVASGGVFNFNPAARPETRQMFLGFGGGVGIRFTPAIEAQLLVQDVRFRLDRSLLPPNGETTLPADPRSDDLWSNLYFGASLGARVGGSRPSTGAAGLDRDISGLYEGSTDNLFIPIEAFGGMIRFHEDFGLGDRGQVGVRTGFDFGSYFGLRGTYWWGAADDFNEIQGIRGWSGEGRFSLGSVARAAPYLTLGVGQIMFEDDFRNDFDLPLSDQATVILGAGIRLPLGRHFRLNGAIRDYVTASGDYEDVASPSDLRHNPAVEVGLSYLLLGRSGERAAVPVAVAPPPPAPAPTPAPAPVADRDTIQPAAPPTATPAPAPAVTADSLAMPAPDPVRGYQSDRMMSIPVPTVGEINIRYGPPAPEAAPPAAPSIIIVPGGNVSGAGVAAPGAAPAAAPAGADTTAALMRVVPLAASGPPGESLAAMESRLAARLDNAILQLSQSPPSSDREVQVLREQVRELTALVSELTRRQSGGAAFAPIQIQPAPAPAAAVAPPVFYADGTQPQSTGGGFEFTGFETRAGAMTVRDGRLGYNLAAEVTFDAFGLETVRPFVGVRGGKVGVRSQYAGSSVFGDVTNFGASLGAHYDLNEIYGLVPTVSAMVTAVGGGTEGSSPQDSQLMDELYSGFSLGPAFGLGVGYPLDPGNRMLVTSRLERLFAGARSGWTLDAGVRVNTSRQPEFRAAAVDVPLPPADVTPPIGGEAMEAAVATPVAEPAEPEEAELIRRLSALEEALREATADRAEQEEAALRREAAAMLEVNAALAVREELGSIAASFPDLVSVIETGRGSEVIVGGALWGVGASSLGERARGAVAAIGRTLARTQGPLIVEGHTDATGSAASNQALSVVRANAVRDALTAEGVSPARITVVGSGQTRPRADNSTIEGRTMNRRVEIVLPR